MEKWNKRCPNCGSFVTKQNKCKNIKCSNYYLKYSVITREYGVEQSKNYYETVQEAYSQYMKTCDNTNIYTGFIYKSKLLTIAETEYLFKQKITKGKSRRKSLRLNNKF